MNSFSSGLIAGLDFILTDGPAVADDQLLNFGIGLVTHPSITPFVGWDSPAPTGVALSFKPARTAQLQTSLNELRGQLWPLRMCL
jgi:hypothetical protein